jgi:hypothetical protein
MGVEMIALLIGIILLVGGAYIFFKELTHFKLSSIGALLVWLIMVVVIITYAEQHDDPWEQYVANGALSLVSALGGFLGALMVIREKFQSLNQRLDDHISSENKVFDQFERRVMEKLDGMAKSRKM